MANRSDSVGGLFICHLTGSIDPSAGGPAYSIPRLCESLRANGNRIELLTIRGPQESLVTTPHHAFELGVAPEKLGHAPGMWRWLNATASELPPDVLHSHNLWVMPSIYPALAQRRWGVPHVVSPRGTLTPYSMASGSSFKKLYWPMVQHPVLRRATGLHATAPSELDDIRRMGLTQPVAIIPNGIEVPSDPTRAATDHRTILYFGRIHPEKGLTTLIEAWSMVHSMHPSWKLKIVGPDEDAHRAQLERLIQAKNISGIAFGNPCYGDSKFEIFRSAAIYVLPSPSENFGLTVAEALSVGVPAIANEGAPWAGLREKRCGWWVEHGPVALADALNQAMQCLPADLHAMGERGRDWMATSFAWPQIAAQMDGFYRFLLGIGSRPSYVDIV